jgi:hypothetical protein
LEGSGCGWLAVAIYQVLHVVGMRVNPPRLRVQATLSVTLSVDDGIGGKAVPAELLKVSKWDRYICQTTLTWVRHCVHTIESHPPSFSMFLHVVSKRFNPVINLPRYSLLTVRALLARLLDELAILRIVILPTLLILSTCLAIMVRTIAWDAGLSAAGVAGADVLVGGSSGLLATALGFGSSDGIGSDVQEWLVNLASPALRVQAPAPPRSRLGDGFALELVEALVVFLCSENLDISVL